ncbi:MAG: DUF554 domain-containing protein [Clostridium sp.]|nr:DUF554 domain-containing protein [Clostridium sp.]
MLGTIVNCITIAVGCFLGLIAKGKIPERIGDTIMKGLALCTMYIGISGALEGTDTLQMIISIAIGALIGEIIDIDKWLEKLGAFLESKFNKKGKSGSIAQGFITSSLLFCVGAMAIVGSLESGLKGDNTTLFTKSILDGISSIIFTSTLGIGVIFSIGTVLIYQGGIAICAGMLSNVLSSVVITNMSAVGGLLILGLGLNMLGVTKIKIANMLPAIFIPIIFGLF